MTPDYCSYTVAMKQKGECKACSRDIEENDAAIKITLERNWFHVSCFFSNALDSDYKINFSMFQGMHRIPPDIQKMIYHYCTQYKQNEKPPPHFSGTAIRLDSLKFVTAASNKTTCDCNCDRLFGKGETKIVYKCRSYMVECLFDEVNRIYGDFEDFKQKMVNVYVSEYYKKYFDNSRIMNVYHETPNYFGVEPGSKRPHDLDIDQIKQKKELYQEQLHDLSKFRGQYTRFSFADRRTIFQQNGLPCPIDMDEQIDVLCDFSVFGVTEKCPDCQVRSPCGSGRLYPNFLTNMYECTDFISVTEKCGTAFQNPGRTKLDLSAEYKRRLPETTVKTRIFLKKETMEKNEFDVVDHKVAAELLESGNALPEGDTVPVEAPYTCYLKNGAPVNTKFSRLQDYHLLGSYHAVLVKVNVEQNRNSYHIIELYEHDTMRQYCRVHTYGRVGMSVGGKEEKILTSKYHAIVEFHKLFELYTQNSWESRPFVQKYGCHSFFETPLRNYRSIPTNSLETPIKNMIAEIVDQETANQLWKVTMRVDKCPLGLLASHQIYQGLKVLDNIAKLLMQGKNVNDQINQFYMCIPHNSGMRPLEALNTLNLVQAKKEWLMELYRSDCHYDIVDPLHQQFEALNCSITRLDEKDENRILIKNKLMTRIEADCDISFELDEVFAINRPGDSANFVDVGNRTLLWHGAPKTEIASILKNGLIPESTGQYNYKKAIYFTDIFSHSLKDTDVLSNDNDKYLFLCDVSLGNSRRVLSQQDFKAEIGPLAGDVQSLHGVGKTGIQETIVHQSGFKVPIGQLVNQEDITVEDQLECNEYAMFNFDYIHIRYLIRGRLTKYISF